MNKTNDTLLTDALRMACDWLVNVAQVKTRTVDMKPLAPGCPVYPYDDWIGAIRNEYSSATREWGFFGTSWHTGQAVKALVLAARTLDDPSLLEPARLSAQFIVNQQVLDPADPMVGYIWAYEDVRDYLPMPLINTSTVLGSLDGLMHLAEAGETRLWDNALAALLCVADTFYSGEGMFRGPYDPAAKAIDPHGFYAKDGTPGRPLLDDGVFLKGYRHSGNAQFKQIFLETADRLLEEEDIIENWITCSPTTKDGGLHARNAYWLGRPMVMAFEETGARKYLNCARRVADFYAKFLRKDGGMFRYTYPNMNFNTDSFGHATSGSACAVLHWMDYRNATEDKSYDELIALALTFCMSMQITRAQDPNLQGCILEKVLPPDGTDTIPFRNRDVGTTFFIQAASRYLEEMNS